jgi:tRNA(adenine34) deaminase
VTISERYTAQVGRWVSLLRDADEKRLVAIRDALSVRRLQWMEENMEILSSLQGDPLEKAYRIILYKIGVEENEAPIAFRDETRLVFHSKNNCPTLTACLALGLDTRRICRTVLESPTDLLVKRVDENLSFGRNYDVIRPQSSYCEEIISYT